jgi:hypothetical protein
MTTTEFSTEISCVIHSNGLQTTIDKQIWTCMNRAEDNGNLQYFDNYTRVYPKVSGLAAWSEDCKWYSPLPLGAVV